MARYLFFFFTGLSSFIFAQDNSQVYVFNIAFAYEGLELYNGEKISENEGYNNQPSFYSEDIVLFSGSRNGQTDIAQYNLSKKELKWISNTDASEYSPKKKPQGNNIASVRLDTHGIQRLFSYEPLSGSSSILFPDLDVAYFEFYNDQILLATVLSGSEMDLVLLNLKDRSSKKIVGNVGRSIQKLGDSKYMSYTSVNDEGNLELFILDIQDKDSYFICQLPVGTQDCLWLNDTQVITGVGNKLFLYDTLGLPEWTPVANLQEYGIKNISRLSLSQNRDKLALVSEEN